MDVSLFRAKADDWSMFGKPTTEERVSGSKETKRHEVPIEVELDLPKPRSGEKFIKGPIPLEWLRIATQCGGRGAEVGLLLWYAAGWQRQNPVKFTASICAQLDVHPKTAKRVIVKMEACGLVRAVFHRGRSPIVTLLRPQGIKVCN